MLAILGNVGLILSKHVCSISYQLIKQKSKPIFSPIKVSLECPVALIQVDNVEQCSDV